MITTSYQKAIDSLTSQGKFYIELGLDRISRILNLLNNPQDELKVIHIAGTNGKGSTTSMLSSVLKESGYKTGMYTSPHLLDYTERIKIDGKDISKEDFAEIFDEVISVADNSGIHLTEFEILTAMAFVYFYRNKVDIVILETGLGGRFDATNVIKQPLLSIITSVDFDHTDRLGNTIEKIAFEKAGIIKPKCPVVTLENNNGLNVIKEQALNKNSELYLAKDKYLLTRYNGSKQTLSFQNEEYELSLLGLWQTKNLSVVLESIKALRKSGFNISDTDLKEGLKKAEWPARMQLIREKKLLIDGAHNPSAAKLLRESLDLYFPDTKRIWLFGSLSTKDFKSSIKLLFKESDTVICTQSRSMSAVQANILAEEILNSTPCRNITVQPDIKSAFENLLSYSDKADILIVCGSLYLAGEILELL